MLRLLTAATLHFVHGLGCGNQLCAEKSETSLIQVHGLSQVSFPSNSTRILSNCDDGEQQIDCFDVDRCAKMAPKTDKFALVTSYVGQVGPDSMPFIKSASAAAKLAKAELLLLLTQDDANFDPAMMSFLSQQGVRVETAPTSMPSQMEFGGSCKPHALTTLQLHLHALGLDRYDAVMFFDNSIEFQGDVTPLLRCASAGNFLATNGQNGEVANFGVLAVKPHRVLFEAALELSKDLEQTLAQNECSVDFLHNALYKRSRMLNTRMLESGQNHSAFQIIDRCMWNYQSSSMCGRDGKEFECSHIRVHREPLGIERGQCLKRKFHNIRRTSMTQTQVQARYVPKPLRPTGHAKLRQEDEHVSYKARFGFYFPVYRRLEGTVEVLRQLRRYYPEEPVYVMQDGGKLDFGPLCKATRFNCTFENLPGMKQPWNPHPFFARLLRATEILQTKFVIYLEPDVKITRRIAVDPPLDAGGLYDSFEGKTSVATMSYIERLARETEPCFVMRWTHYGLAGGSYFRSLAIRDALSPENLRRMDWNFILHHTRVVKAIASDFAVHLAISARAWNVYPWQEVSMSDKRCLYSSPEIRQRQEKYPACNPNAAFIHWHKEQYGANISDEDRSLVATFPNRTDTRCSGCVWYKDGSPESVMPIPSDPPEVKGSPDFHFAEIDQTDCGAVAQETWYYCAAEGEHCDCRSDIRLGNNDTWHLISSSDRQSGPFFCSGDVLPEIKDADKHCECLGQWARSRDSSPITAVSCKMFFEAREKTAFDRAQWSAVEGLCRDVASAMPSGPRQICLQNRTKLFSADVIPEFKQVMDQLTENGWFKEAYVSYVDGFHDSPYVDMATELIKSVHYFSTRPIVVFVFGEFVPNAWTPKRFPRLVVLQSGFLPQENYIYRSFNFNKIRAILLSKVKHGGVFLEADSWILPGADALFDTVQKHIEEKRYAFPLLPLHYKNVISKSSGIGNSNWWSRYCPDPAKPCPKQTMKFAQSLPIWNHRSLEFFGRWLGHHFRDQLLSPVIVEGFLVAEKLRVGDVMEDDELLNIGLWEDGAEKQLCQFDQTPSSLEPLLSWQHNENCLNCRDADEDPRFYQDGSPSVFLTVHQAKNSTESAEYLENIRSKYVEGKWPPSSIVYKKKFWKSALELQKAYPELSCLI